MWDWASLWGSAGSTEHWASLMASFLLALWLWVPCSGYCWRCDCFPQFLFKCWGAPALSTITSPPISLKLTLENSIVTSILSPVSFWAVCFPHCVYGYSGCILGDSVPCRLSPIPLRLAVSGLVDLLTLSWLSALSPLCRLSAPFWAPGLMDHGCFPCLTSLWPCWSVQNWETLQGKEHTERERL